LKEKEKEKPSKKRGEERTAEPKYYTHRTHWGAIKAIDRKIKG
jgi:hypothetical protein